MRTLEQNELQEILVGHKKWLETDRQEGSYADLRDADLRFVDLSNTDLRFADLRNADLRGADLSFAVLRDANLKNADLRNADLRGADLSFADLSFADLRFANLRNADLSDADLSFADLSFADLRFANLSGADLRFANLRNADLNWTTTEGLKGQQIIAIQIDTSRPNNVISYWTDLGIVTTGCFQGTLEELEEQVELTHKENGLLRNRYHKVIEFFKSVEEEEK